MIIAVTYKDGEVFQHFGHSEQFKIYETEGSEIVSGKVVDINGCTYIGCTVGVDRTGRGSSDLRGNRRRSQECPC